LISASGAGPCAESLDASPSLSPEPAACSNAAVRSRAFALGQSNKNQILRLGLALPALVAHWALHDLGISKAEFLGAMNATHNRLYLGGQSIGKALIERQERRRSST